jgi:hypothetical protein
MIAPRGLTARGPAKVRLKARYTIEWIRKAMRLNPYAQMKDTEHAALHKAEVLKRIPGFTIREHCLPMLHYQRESDLAHHLEALRKAGLST